MKNSPQLVVVQVANYFNLKFMKQKGIRNSKHTNKNTPKWEEKKKESIL
jgi:hypothetical protein